MQSMSSNISTMHRRSLITGLGLAGIVPWSISSSRSASAEKGFWLQVLSPGPAGISDHNQLRDPKPYTVHIDDAAARVSPGRVTIEGIAKGMKNLAVVPAGGPWRTTIPDAEGWFSVQVDIPEANGPFPLDVYAWNSPPNDHSYTVNLNARLILFVVGGQDAQKAADARPGHPAAGMKLIWQDDFTTGLSGSSSGTRDATWFIGGKPSSTGSQYSDALFVKAGDKRNPFFVRDGFLRIRATHDPRLIDPNGWNRKWWSGHLSTGFPDETASVAFREGYAEIRMMTPLGPGAWPAFWLLDSSSTLPSRTYGAVEIDVVEAYGHDQSWYMATAHRWPGAEQNSGKYENIHKGIPVAGHANAFHTYGIRLTRSEMIWYLDDKEVQRAPLYRADTVSPFFLMANLSMGGGWPSRVPPAGYYDLWIDHIRVYA